jgi:hypothetical protein
MDDHVMRQPEGQPPTGADAGAPPHGRLPRRDFFILPLISILTIVFLLGLAEIGSRALWPERQADSCSIPDTTLPHRFKPNCQSLMKAVDGPWVTNDYNACGYRTDAPCGPRSGDVLRVDMLGSSFGQSFLAPYDSSVGATLERDLTKQCRRPVQVENMSGGGYQGEVIYRQLDEALALKPDAIVFLVTVLDFEIEGRDFAKVADPEAAASPQLLPRIRNWLLQSRTVDVARHFMFADADRYGLFYLKYGDRADFLRPPFTKLWRDRLAYFDSLIGRMQAKIGAAGVPFVLVYVPSHAEAAFIAAPSPPKGIDPYALGNAIGRIASDHGVAYVNLADKFRSVPRAGDLFYAANGHLSARGNPIVGQYVATQLAGDVPAFRTCD